MLFVSEAFFAGMLLRGNQQTFRFLNVEIEM
jgi:hypothetical protein